MIPFYVNQVSAEETPGATEVETVVLIDGAAIYGYALVWAVVIIGLVELVKRLWVVWAKGKTDMYNRAIPLLPVLLGTASAPVFGPSTLAAFSLKFTPAEAIWFGPGAGALAGWGFALVKHTVVPMLPGAVQGFFSRVFGGGGR